MHWTQHKQYTAIAQARNRHLDELFDDALHRDQCQSACAQTPDVLNLLHTEADAPPTSAPTTGTPTTTAASTTANAGAS